MQKNNKTSKKHFLSTRGQRIMLTSIVICVCICAALFSILGVYMSKNTGTAVDNISEKYMREASFQITQRFETVMQQRIGRVEALIDEYGGANTSEARQMLADSAEKRGFKYLAFMRVNEDNIADESEGRELDLISNIAFVGIDTIPFRMSVLKGEQKIAVGRSIPQDGSVPEDLVLCAFPVDDHIMPSGEKSMALVGGFSNKDFVDMLNINSDENSNTVAYIIRDDVLADGETNSLLLKRDEDEEYSSLSALLKTELKNSENPIENVINELNASMAEKKVYSGIIHIGDNHIHMYCNALGLSEWYLVTLTNNVELTGTVNTLNTQWVVMIVVAVVAIVLSLIAIFVLYNYYNRKTLIQLERAREEAIDASKAKSEFLSNMSHDIRTPMNAIVGMTAIAMSNIDNRQQVQDCLKKITVSSKHLLGLINDVLDMSKIESGKMTLNMECVSLSEIMGGISTIVQPQIKNKSQNFDIFIGNIISEKVYCDSVRFNQILLNLLSNAIKFTPNGGSVEISLRQEESPVGENYVRNIVDVKDTGIGMTPQFLDKIFESFTREDNLRVNKTEGTGLGMTITKYIVDAMHGTISAESELGKGSHFNVVIDLEKVHTNEEMILPDWNMLVVDDDEQLCRTTVCSLKEIGICAEWTLTGEEAIEKTIERYNAHVPFDVIMLDWKLPGIDGLETARRIRKKFGEEIPILLISAYDWSDMEEEARKAGINGFISKPLFKSTLYYGLRKYVQEGADGGKENAITNETVDLSGKHILIAEDNDLNWEIAETLLEDAGMEVERAENGKICVEKLQSSAHGTYDAILMDIRMPVMTGYEATVAIRKLDRPDKDLPIIAMTADAFADDMKKCLDCGMNAHVAKPIDIDLLIATLKKFIIT